MDELFFSWRFHQHGSQNRNIISDGSRSQAHRPWSTKIEKFSFGIFLLTFSFWFKKTSKSPWVFSYIVYIVSQYGQFKFAYRVLSCRNRLFLHFKTKKRRGEYIYPAPSFPTRSWVCDVWHRDNTPPFFPTWLKSNKKGTLLFPSCIFRETLFFPFLFCVWFLSLWLLRFLRPRVDDVRVDGGKRLTVGSDLRWMSRAWLRSTQPPTTTVHTPGVYSLWLVLRCSCVCLSLSTVD